MELRTDRRVADQVDKTGPRMQINDDMSDAGQTLSGLLGEDPDSQARRRRQQEQLRGWLLQQQREQAAARQQSRLQEHDYDRSRVEMDNVAVRLLRADTERRKAAIIDTVKFNLQQAEQKEKQRQLEGGCDDATLGMMAGLGLSSCRNRRTPPESLQEITQFQKRQTETKKRMELERRREEEQYVEACVASAQAALLTDKQQAVQKRRLRQQLDNINHSLAQIHRQRKPDIERGRIDDSFFSKFNTGGRR